MIKKILFLICSFCITTLIYAKPLELVFWHSMAGSLGEEVKRLVQDFNQSQHEFEIKPVYKGDYVETLTSFAASFRAHQAPALIQLYEVGTAMILSPQGIIKPVDELMHEQGLQLPKEDFIASVREFYSNNDLLMAMPFNLSAPVLYYNQDALAKVGYKPEHFPKTWLEFEVLVKKLKRAGFHCAYTSAYPGWILIESYLAIHGLEQMNRSIFNKDELLWHLKRLKRWQRLGYFKYGGRVDDATVLFTSGICPMFSQSSGAYNSLSALTPFRLGVALMPLDTELCAKRYANVAGGGALWAVSGQTAVQYRGIAEFLLFLAQAETQQRWHEHTGYLPIGLSGIYRGLAQSSTHPVAGLALKDLSGESPAKTRHALGPQNQIRHINDDLLEAMFAGLLSPESALQEALNRVNRAFIRFAKNTGDHINQG